MSVATSLRPFLNWGNVFTLFPRYNRETMQFKATPIRGLFNFIFLQWTFVYCLYNRLETHFMIFTRLQEVIVVITTSCLQLLVSLTILGSFRWNVSRMQKIFDTFNSIDAILSTQNISNDGRLKRTNFFLLWMHLVFFGMCTVDVIIWSRNLPVYKYHYMMYDQITMYLVFGTIIFEVLLLRHIRWRFESVNLVLNKPNCYAPYYGVLVDLHSKCCDLVDIFNDMQGWNIFFTIIHLIMNMLICIQVILMKDIVWNASTITQMFLWSLYMAVS
ncbi:PREDICTED: uncharacterized protein LOC108557756 [Nicrophorus vespilloides]|uniref:Uncharacterized protein LOC108557756 n=1 Tax=Nicrophorus vespilloides TaxID=110193 RepID=A0ABM1M5P7_NICVS|nr:PREDICTED: uncharacterized protein LOC108557756 [Nicrophorus vespilloides]